MQQSLLILASISTGALAYEAPYFLNEEESTVPNSYVVTLGTKCVLEQHVQSFSFSGNFSIDNFNSVINVYSATFLPDELKEVRSDPCVTRVMVDYFLKSVPERGRKVVKTNSPLGKREEIETQHRASWNLALMAMRDRQDFSAAVTENIQYLYNYTSNAGQGVDVYVIAKGFDLRQHIKLSGVSLMAQYGRSATMQDEDLGNHVASLVGSYSYGVAKEANVLAVAAETYAHILRALDSIIRKHDGKLDRRRRDRTSVEAREWKGSVIVFAQGFTSSVFPDELVELAKRVDGRGILLVGTAGEQQGEQNEVLPCVLPGVLCVGGIDHNYQILPRSLRGPAINLWGPAAYIPGAEARHRVTADTHTSFAAPHVAGVAAIILGEEVGRNSVRDDQFLKNTFSLKLYIFANAKTNYIQPVEQSRNLLANTGINSHTGFPKPYAEPNYLQQISAELGASLFNVQNHVFSKEEAKSRGLDCLRPQRSWLKGVPSKIKVTRRLAEQLWLRVKWEAGHSFFYAGTGEYAPLVPCIDDACVYLKTHSRTREPFYIENVSKVSNGTHDSDLATHLLHIIIKCREHDMNSWRSTRMVGGSMQVTEMPGLYIYLRKKI